MSPKYPAAVPASTIAHDDPVWQAILAAPLDDSPDTEEELAAIEAAKRPGFRWVSGAEVSAAIGQGNVVHLAAR